jgi:copper(I)-binding protein
VRAVPPGAHVSAAYLTLTNRAGAADTLTSVSTGAAQVVEIHRVEVTEEGTMRMRPIEFLAIPAGETVRLKPGGDHLMLIGLTQAPAEDQDVSLTLRFRRAGEVRMTAKAVRSR